jgi:O-antigen/teichoic acid export membrane protein
VAFAAWPSLAGARAPLSEASRRFREGLRGRRTFLYFVLSVGAVNLSALVANAVAFRWVDPASMGVWHTLLLASSYLIVVRFGLVNGMGRELPFALGAGDRDRAGRIAATALAYNTACTAVVGLAFLSALPAWWASGAAWRWALPAMAVVSAANLYLTYLQATLRSEGDFLKLAHIHWLQAGTGLLAPVLVAFFGFPGLSLHAAIQVVVVTACAHVVRPFRVRPRFEPALARELLATGLPLFLASYLHTLAGGFDRVILLHRGGVEAVGYYAPALAVLAAMAIVPGAVSTYVLPRMSYALGRGRSRSELRGMALGAGAASFLVGLPLAVVGWLAAPHLVTRFFPQYVASLPAVRWSLLAGVFWSVAPASNLLSSLKAWRSLWLYIALVVAARWTGPWLLSRVYEPLEGVALGNLVAAVLVAGFTWALVHRAGAPVREAPAP